MDDDQGMPEILYSEYEERPFCTCTMCGESLVEFEEGYQISKVFRRGECVFEYALCHPCHDKMTEELSVESRDAVRQFHEENIESGHGLEKCACCHRTKDDWEEEDPEFSLAAACLHDVMVDGIMICIDCTEGIQSLLSVQTKERRDRFVEENFPCAPNETAPVPSGVGVL